MTIALSILGYMGAQSIGMNHDKSLAVAATVLLSIAFIFIIASFITYRNYKNDMRMSGSSKNNSGDSYFTFMWGSGGSSSHSDGGSSGGDGGGGGD